MAFVLAACSIARDEKRTPPPPEPAASASEAPVSSAAPAASASASSEAANAGPPHSDPMSLHHETKEELLALFEIERPVRVKNIDADGFLDKTFGPDGPYTSNQGNKELSKHFISKEECMQGLSGFTLQTDEQKQICGAENMVPIYKKGDVSKAKTCVDIFEFPNKPCELPFVWIGATQARQVCELQGKRLCRQPEWELACAGDPDGGPDQKYSYGNDLDLDVCNTNKSATEYGPGCVPDSPKTAWKTCATNTEPSGAFPKCRSRFGVFDMQGNVAEIMSRFDPDGHTYDQLKGSAFFYTDVARDEFGRAPKGHPPIKPERMRGTYPDICKHDPRWHVEPINDAWHVNYHLGFRCCKDIPKPKKEKDEQVKTGDF